MAVHPDLGAGGAARPGSLALDPRRPGTPRRSAAFPVLFTLVRLASINALLAAFNLIPLPPLDGGQIALHLLPPDWAARLAALRPYGFMIGIGLALLVVPLAAPALLRHPGRGDQSILRRRIE